MAKGMSIKQTKLPQNSDELRLKDFLARYKYLKERRTNWDKVYQRVAEYVIPHYEDIGQTREAGFQFAQKIFDGTAVRALEIQTNGFFGYTASPSQPWFRYAAMVRELMKYPEVATYLQECEEQMYYAFMRSNFYEEYFNLIRNGGGMGTGVMLIEEDFVSNKVVCETLHPGQAYVAQNHERVIDTLYREYTIEMREAVKRFGYEALSKEQQKKFEDNPYSPMKILRVYSPREERDPYKIDSKNMPYASCWIDLDSKKLLREGGYKESPIISWRYDMLAGFEYGTCPSMTVLPIIMGANFQAEDMLWVSQMTATPPIQAPSSMEGKVIAEPKAFNWLDSPDDQIRPIQMAGDYRIGVDREERTQATIKEAFSVNYFMMLANAEREMTAQEVIERQAEKAIGLAPVTARLSKTLDAIHTRVFAIEERAGRMPTPPQILLDMGEYGSLDIIHLGPLAQVQARLFQTHGIKQAINSIAMIAQLDQTVLDNFDLDDASVRSAKADGAPQSMIRDKDKVLALRQSRQQAMAQQQAMAMGAAQASTFKDAAKASKDMGGDMNEQILEAAGGAIG